MLGAAGAVVAVVPTEREDDGHGHQFGAEPVGQRRRLLPGTADGARPGRGQRHGRRGQPDGRAAPRHREADGHGGAHLHRPLLVRPRLLSGAAARPAQRRLGRAPPLHQGRRLPLDQVSSCFLITYMKHPFLNLLFYRSL